MSVVACQDVYLSPSEFIYIRVCSKTYKVKRCQLVQKSIYFRELLRYRTSTCVITLDNVELDTFDVVLQWLHTNNFQPQQLTLKHIIEVFNLSLQLKMPDLIAGCKEYITQSFLDTNITDIYQLIEQYGSIDLFQTIHDVLTTSFENIVKNPNFLRFNVDFVCMLLSDDNIITSSERVVFDAAIQWLNYDWNFRSKYAVDVMSTVRMSLMTKHQLLLASLKTSTNPVLELPRVQTMLLKAFMFHAAVKTCRVSCFPDLIPVARVRLPCGDFEQPSMPEAPQVYIAQQNKIEKCQTSTPSLPPRTMPYFDDQRTCVQRSPEVPSCGFTGRAGQDKAKSKSPPRAKSSSKTFSPMCTSRRPPNRPKSNSGRSRVEQAVTTIQAYTRGYLTRRWLKQERKAANQIQKIFRKWQNKKRATVKSPSPTTSGTTEESSENERCLALTDVPSILVIGGLDPNQKPVTTATTLLRYDPLLNLWTSISSTPIPFVQSACAKLHNNIYITGGICVTYKAKSATTKSTWCLNYQNGEWKKCRDMIYARAYHSLVGYCGKIFAIGGKSTDDNILNSAEYYEPGLDRWFQITPMHCARMAMAAVEFHELIWVCGGASRDADGTTVAIVGSVECYSYFTNTWCVQVPLCVPRMSAMLVSTSGTMALLGGAAHKPGPVEAEVYVLERESWSVSRPIHRSRESSACVQLLDLTFLIGGYSSEEESVLKSVECFLPGLSDKVDYVPDLPYPLNGHCAVVMAPVLKSLA